MSEPKVGRRGILPKVKGAEWQARLDGSEGGQAEAASGEDQNFGTEGRKDDVCEQSWWWW